MSAPSVAVVVAARDEAGAIAALLDSLDAQTYAHELIEVVIADGGSRDGTPQVVRDWSREKDLRVRVIDNQDRVTASGSNAGIQATVSDVVVILGAHAEVPPDFVERSVATLQESGAACAGGTLVTLGGPTPMGRAIAAATTCPIGVGNARFRTGSAASCDVDTVAFGAYRRDVFDRIGGFDVSLVGAEDDELNFRLVSSGAVIRLDPSITATYYCRTSLPALARQYFLYGRGKAWVLRKHRRPPSARMLAPAALVASVAAGVVGGIATRRAAVALAPVVPYAAAVTLGAARAARDAEVSGARVAAALVTIHSCYGVGLFAGLLRRPGTRPSRSS